VPNPDDVVPSWAKGRVTPADLEHLGALSVSSGWRVDLGLTLGHPDAAAAANEASVATRLIGSGLSTVEIGNEPDVYAADKSLEPYGHSSSDYRNEVAAYRTAIAATAPGVQMAGPDTAGVDGLAAYAGNEGPGLSFLTQHFYPLTRCGGRHPTIADLLSPATRQRQTSLVDSVVAAASTVGLPVRIDETNSASCGGEDGVSNTLASALWTVDYLLLAGQRGVAGVDVHGGLAACRGYTVLCVPGAAGSAAEARPGIDRVADASLGAAVGTGPLSAQPVFYGLLLVRQLEGGRWLSVGSKPASPLRVFALAMADGSVRVVLDNPDRGFSARVVIRVGARRAVTSVLRLTGPSLASTSGIRLGGAAVATDGTWSPVSAGPRPPATETPTIDLGPSTAAIVSVSAPAP
jgi:hypothetical protein